MQSKPQNLRQALVAYFTEEDIRNICQDLALEADNFGNRKIAITRELVTYLQKENRLIELKNVCERARPHVDWDVYFREHRQTASFKEPSPDRRLTYFILGFIALLIVFLIAGIPYLMVAGAAVIGTLLLILLAILDD